MLGCHYFSISQSGEEKQPRGQAGSALLVCLQPGEQLLLSVIRRNANQFGLPGLAKIKDAPKLRPPWPVLVGVQFIRFVISYER